jgi:putative tricarboxylic transport membrane protein
MTCDKDNLVASAVLAAFGVYIIWVAARLPYVSDVGPGPGFFPIWLGIGLALCSSGLAFSSVSFSASVTKGEKQSSSSLRRPLAGWVAIMIAVALLGKLGFALTFIILTIFLIVVLERRPILLAASVAFGLAVAFHLVFIIALDVSLPKAIWGF